MTRLPLDSRYLGTIFITMHFKISDIKEDTKNENR